MAIRNPQYQSDRSDLLDRIVSLNRVAKVVKGGRKFSFSAMVVVGDGNGRVGAGLGKAREVPEAIRKGMDIAKRSMITVPMVGSTIPHEIRYKWGAAKILLKPAAPGTGVISGGAMRAVIELSGVKDILTKSLGTNNPINTVRATIAALQELRTAQEVAELRGKGLDEIVGKQLAEAYRTAAAAGTIHVPPEVSNAVPVGAPTPADAVRRPATAVPRPAPEGQARTPRPAPQRQAPTTRPAPEGQAPTTRPAPEGEAPTTRPAPEGEAPTTRPAPEGEAPTTRPAPEAAPSEEPQP